jgi:hypothetical protein
VSVGWHLQSSLGLFCSRPWHDMCCFSLGRGFGCRRWADGYYSLQLHAIEIAHDDGHLGPLSSLGQQSSLAQIAGRLGGGSAGAVAVRSVVEGGMPLGDGRLVVVVMMMIMMLVVEMLLVLVLALELVLVLQGLRMLGRRGSQTAKEDGLLFVRGRGRRQGGRGCEARGAAVALEGGRGLGAWRGGLGGRV